MKTSDLSERSSLLVKNADASIAPVAMDRNLATIRPEDFLVLPVDDQISLTGDRTQPRKASQRVKTETRHESFASRKKGEAPLKTGFRESADTYAVKRRPQKSTPKTDHLSSFGDHEVIVTGSPPKPRSEKGSLVANVVKKPYKWIKALGSKLF